jgi:WD40 repeat protein
MNGSTGTTGTSGDSAKRLPRLSPCRTVVTSFNPKKSQPCAISSSSSNNNNNGDYFDDGDWVLCVAANDATARIGCALSNGEIQIYDQNTLHNLHTYSNHDALVTEMTFDTCNPHLLATTATDGSLMLYDIRQQQQQNGGPAMAYTNLLRQDEESLSLSMGFDGAIAAVGSSRGKIHFMDTRSNRGLLGTYHEAHTKEVTRVRFRDPSSPVLVSGSEDGLACVFDTSQPTEESAITNILTVESPIREVGFFGPQREAIYCLTGSESLRLYHKDDAVCRKDFGSQFRDYLNGQIGSAQDNTISSAASGRMEYLVDCHWDGQSQELVLLAGSSMGDGAIFRVGDHAVSPMLYLRGGHRGVIRAWSCSRSSFLTVGEDARLCEWNHHSSGSSSSNNRGNQIIMARKRQGGPMAPRGGKLRKPRSRMSASPY